MLQSTAVALANPPTLESFPITYCAKMPVAVVVSSDPSTSVSLLTTDTDPDFTTSRAAVASVLAGEWVSGAHEEAQGRGGQVASTVIEGVTEPVIKDQ